MTTEEFNALPLEARRFIETHAGCLSCGNPAQKLTRAYELYKSYKMAHVYQLKGGGINYQVDGKAGVLYNIKDTDSDFEKKEKLGIARKLHVAKPSIFIIYDEKAIDDLLESLNVEVVDLDAEWAERSGVLGIDTKTASYDELKAYSAIKGLLPKGQKKVDFIEAIDAIDTELL